MLTLEKHLAIPIKFITVYRGITWMEDTTLITIWQKIQSDQLQWAGRTTFSVETTLRLKMLP